MTKTPEAVYTADEVAAMYAVKRITVWDWIRKGKLRALNIGTKGQPCYRIKESHLAKFEKERS